MSGSGKIAAAPLEGDYDAPHVIVYYETGMEHREEVTDMLTVIRRGADGLHVKAEIVADNFDQCFFEKDMAPMGNATWSWRKGSSSCVVTLRRTANEWVLDSTWDCKDEFCGQRGFLRASFPLSSHQAVGSYEWPKR